MSQIATRTEMAEKIIELQEALQKEKKRAEKAESKIRELYEEINRTEALILPELCGTCAGNKKGTCRDIVRKRFKELKQ